MKSAAPTTSTLTASLDPLTGVVKTAPVLPLLKAEVLGTELNHLTRDDGARLAEILGELDAEARREPGNLLTATALTHALSLAGRTTEARAEAQRSFQVMSRLPAVDPRVRLNVLSGLADTGQFADIIACATPLLTRELPPEQRYRLVRSLLGASLRTGDPQYYALLDLEPPPEFVFLQRAGLIDWWPRQQQAIEAKIGPRVARDAYQMFTDPESGTVELALDYYTDATSQEAVEALYEQLDDILDALYADHPDGPGATLGKIIIAITGPYIPLPKATA